MGSGTLGWVIKDELPAWLSFERRASAISAGVAIDFMKGVKVLSTSMILNKDDQLKARVWAVAKFMGEVAQMIAAAR